jgi:hypothetical protein
MRLPISRPKILTDLVIQQCFGTLNGERLATPESRTSFRVYQIANSRSTDLTNFTVKNPRWTVSVKEIAFNFATFVRFERE